MRLRVGSGLRVVGWAALLVAITLAVPTAAVTPGPVAGGSLDDAAPGVIPPAEPEPTHTVPVTYDVELPAEGEDRVTMSIRVQDVEGQRLVFRLHGSDFEVLEAQGFDVEEGRWLVTTGDQRDASVTVSYDPTEHISSPVRDEFTATPDWALIRITINPPDDVALEETVLPDGIRGRQFLFVGPHDVYERTVGEERIRLVVPEAAELADPPAKIVDSLAYSSNFLRVAGREKEVFAVAAPAAIRRGGFVSPGGEDFLVSADIPLSWNAWTHEYVHLRQDRAYDADAAWLAEAEARYYQHLLAYKRGDIAHEPTGSTGFDAFQAHLRAYDGHDDVRLTDRSTWESLSHYEKGARVIAALDAEIRERTDGEKDYRDVMRELNHDSTVTADDFEAAVTAVAGEELDHFLSAYVSGTEMPPVPADPDRYQTGPFEPDVRYAVSANVTRGGPEDANVAGKPVFAGESVTITYTVENVGTDAALEPRIDVSPPASWEHIGTTVAGQGWGRAGDTAGKAREFGPGETATIEVYLAVPAWANLPAFMPLSVEDVDGAGVERTTRLDPVGLVEPHLTVDRPVHEPGTEIVLDASESELPGDGGTYAWDLTGDGAVDRETDEPTLRTTFEPGSRVVGVTVTSEEGVSETASMRVNTTDTPVISVTERVVIRPDEWVEIPVNVSNEHGETWVTWRLPGGRNVTMEPGVFTATPGVYDLGVVVTDTYGATNETTIEFVSVDRPGLEPFVPRYTSADRAVPLRVVVDNVVGEYEVTWELPDGTTRTEEAFKVDLPPGHHEVTVRIADEYGYEANETRTVTVSDVPNLVIDGPETVTAGDQVTLEATVENEIGDVIVAWSHGNETIETRSDHAVTLEFEPGEHEVNVTVTDEFGGETTVTHSLLAKEPQAQPGFGIPLAGVALGWVTLAVLLSRLVRSRATTSGSADR